jgi:hypothetical protein
MVTLGGRCRVNFLEKENKGLMRGEKGWAFGLALAQKN